MWTNAQKTKAASMINRKLEQTYSEQEIETFEWYIDVETPNSYGWKFHYPARQEVWSYNYDRKTQRVEIRKENSNDK